MYKRTKSDKVLLRYFPPPGSPLSAICIIFGRSHVFLNKPKLNKIFFILVTHLMTDLWFIVTGCDSIHGCVYSGDECGRRDPLQAAAAAYRLPHSTALDVVRDRITERTIGTTHCACAANKATATSRNHIKINFGRELKKFRLLKQVSQPTDCI
jgi:hypothetical protein